MASSGIYSIFVSSANEITLLLTKDGRSLMKM